MRSGSAMMDPGTALKKRKRQDVGVSLSLEKFENRSEKMSPVSGQEFQKIDINEVRIVSQSKNRGNDGHFSMVMPHRGSSGNFNINLATFHQSSQ